MMENISTDGNQRTAEVIFGAGINQMEINWFIQPFALPAFW